MGFSESKQRSPDQLLCRLAQCQAKLGQGKEHCDQLVMSARGTGAGGGDVVAKYLSGTLYGMDGCSHFTDKTLKAQRS